MEITATYVFNAPVVRVWDLLMDTTVISGCLPGCKGLTPIGEDTYEAELAVAVAAISGNFKGTITLADRTPPERYTLVVEGRGRPGFVKGRAVITLAQDGENTSVRIAAEAEAGGTIARVGQRLLEGVARMMMDRFFGCLARQCGAQ